MTIARPLGFQVIAIPSTPRQPRPNVLRRLLDSLFAARERDAQRAVEAYVARRGYRLTDSLEREIGELMLDGQSKFNR